MAMKFAIKPDKRNCVSMIFLAPDREVRDKGGNRKGRMGVITICHGIQHEESCVDGCGETVFRVG